MISVEIQRELQWFIFVLFIGAGRVIHNAANAAPRKVLRAVKYALFLMRSNLYSSFSPAIIQGGLDVEAS